MKRHKFTRNPKMPLVTLFDFFVAERIENRSPGYASRYALAIQWLGWHLGREPLLSDLTAETFRGFYGFCLSRGRSPATVDGHRKRLGTLARYAAERGLIDAAHVPLLDNRAPPAAVEKWTKPGTLGYAYANTFKPTAMACAAQATVCGYDAAVTKFLTFAGQDIAVDAVTKPMLAEFRKWLATTAGVSGYTVDRYGWNVERVVRYFRPEAMPRAQVQAAKLREAKEAPEGSLRWFYLTRYLSEHALAKNSDWFYRFVIRKYSNFLGREAMLSDLDALQINAFVAQRLETKAPRTVKGDRAALSVLWRAAFDWGLVPELPRRLRKVKIPPQAPEAWTLAEMTLLLAACDHEKFDREACGVHVGRFFSAFIRAAYDSALRLGDLLAVTWNDAKQDGRVVIRMGKTQFIHTAVLRPSTWDAIAKVHRDDDDRLLPWLGSRTTLRKWFLEILATAGLRGRGNASQRLRRTSASHVEAERPGSATNHLGHRDASLARRHYLDPALTSTASLPPAIPETKRIEGPKDDEPKDGAA